MRRLTKTDEARRDELVKDLNEAFAELEKVAGEANAAIDAANGKVQAAVASYNAVVAEVETFRDDLVSQMEDYIGDRSESWEETEGGREYTEWKDQWESLDTDNLEIEELPEIDPGTADHADELEALPSDRHG